MTSEQPDSPSGGNSSGEWNLPFEEMIEKLNDGVLVVEMDGTIIYANPSMAEMIGYGRREMIGGQLFDFMDEQWAQRARENLERRKKGVEEMFDHRWQHKDGGGVWTLVSAKPMKDDEGTQWGSLVAIQDISERKRMEKQLREARDELEQRVRARTRELREINEKLEREVEERARAEREAREANRAKSAFLANMSHELRTPLNAVIGYSELLQEELDATADPSELSVEQIRRDLDKVEHAGNHLLALINDILDLTKIESGQLELLDESFDFDRIVDEVVETVRPRAAEGGNEVRADHGYRGEFVGDPTRVKQILLNLASNAAKFTEEGLVEISTSEETVDDRPGVAVRVSDTGIGMAQEDIDRLFEPFTQADESPTREYGGTGLGLTISKRFTERMGGTIEVESREGVGTTFTVRLPSRES